ncbi:MAG: acyltransferase family protein, partial [Bacteroidota bacterium]
LHHLDALRAFAMLLGIVLHTALGFVPGLWFIEDPTASWRGPFDEVFFFVHGFRMPLFFLLSGFFSAMLLQRRGLWGLVKHRLRRVGLPLLVAVVTILPAVGVGILVGQAWANDAAPAGTAEVQAVEAAPPGLDGFRILDSDRDIRDNRSFRFAHLWFLWYLLWMLAGLAVAAGAVSVVQRVIQIPPLAGTISLWALPLLTLLPSLLMGDPVRGFGPDTPEGFWPLPRLLAYYGSFFAFGILLFGRTDRRGRPLHDAIGRPWRILLPGALVLFPFALWLTFSASGAWWPAVAAAQVAFTWLMVFGLVGLGQHILSGERFWVRFVSDAAYWIYLAHLPLVFLAQGLVAGWPLPAGVKFTVICLGVAGVLLVTYRWGVRYTVVGRLLNGPRTRDADRAMRERLHTA